MVELQHIEKDNNRTGTNPRLHNILVQCQDVDAEDCRSQAY